MSFWLRFGLFVASIELENLGGDFLTWEILGMQVVWRLKENGNFWISHRRKPVVDDLCKRSTSIVTGLFPIFRGKCQHDVSGRWALALGELLSLRSRRWSHLFVKAAFVNPEFFFYDPEFATLH